MNNWENPNNLALAELVGKTNNYDQQLTDTIVYTKLAVNGYEVYQTSDMPSQMGTLTSFFKKNNGYLSVTLSIYSKDKPFKNQDQIYSIYNQILSTFKFTQ